MPAPTYDPADKRRIERLKSMLTACRERNGALLEEVERLKASIDDGDPDHARMVTRIAALTNTILELRQQLADAKGTFAE
jgi:chromosome segregation ATPase